MSAVTDPVVIVRAWLAGDPGVTALTTDRVSSTYDPDGGFPAVVIVGATGGPRMVANGDSGLRDWTVTLWCLAGRLDAGASDLPATQTAWRVAQAVTTAAEAVDTTHYTHGPSGARLRRADVLSVTRGTDPSTGWARTNVALRLLVAE